MAGRVSKIDIWDVVIFTVLTAGGFIIILPFLNVVALSLTNYREYLNTPLLIFPKVIDLKNYSDLFKDGRIWIGYRTSLIIVGIGVPLSLLLSASTGYALSRRGWPGRKHYFYFVLFTMIFQGGIVPLYMVVRWLRLTNTLWSVIFATSMNTFYMILMYNFFQSLPESLIESARLDGASEWRILFSIIIPLSMPIMATLTLFYTVDKWNEWFNPMVFIRRGNIQPLQLVLRSIVYDMAATSVGLENPEDMVFTNGMKMAAVFVTMLPVMCVFPFLQKHFAKGIMVGAIKA